MSSNRTPAEGRIKDISGIKAAALTISGFILFALTVYVLEKMGLPILFSVFVPIFYIFYLINSGIEGGIKGIIKRRELKATITALLVIFFFVFLILICVNLTNITFSGFYHIPGPGEYGYQYGAGLPNPIPVLIWLTIFAGYAITIFAIIFFVLKAIKKL